MKLTTYILSLLCVLGFCASFITGYFVYNTVVTTTIQNLSDAQLKRTQQTLKDLDYTLHEAFRGIVGIANFYSHSQLPDETNQEKSRQMLIDVANELSTPWDALHIFDRSGNLRLSTQYLPGSLRKKIENNPLHIDALLTAELANTWNTDLIMDPESGQPVILFAAPIRDKTDPQRPVVGVAIGYFSWLRFSELLFNVSDTRLTMLNRDGDFIASNNAYNTSLPLEVSFADHPSISTHIANPDSSPDPQIILDESDPDPSTYGISKGIVQSLENPDELVIQSVAIEQGQFEKAGNSWLIIAETPIESVLFQARQIGIQQALLNSGMIFLGFGLTYLVLRREVTKPISTLNQAVVSITHGLFKTRISTQTVNTREIQTLSIAFNRMAERLELAREHSNLAHRLQRMVDQSVAGQMTINRRFEITYCNQAARKTFHKHAASFQSKWKDFDPKQLHGYKFDVLIDESTDQKELLADPSNLPYQQDIPVDQLTFQITITAIYDEYGHYDGNAVEWENVTEKREATRLQQEAEQALRDSLQELDQFAYIASHDLRTPLQGISLLAEWIAEDDIENLSPSSAQNLHRIHERCQRLGRLLDDLLTYSRSGKVLGEIREVNTDNLLKELSEILDPEDQYKIRANGNLPTFDTYNAPFELVLRNLIQNAIKHHNKPTGVIELSCEEEGNNYRFSVKDDGPGIKPEHMEKIFGMFKSFQNVDDENSNPEPTSSGIGLAIIKKTVESFDCEVVVNSTPGLGSTFSFSWPKKVTAQKVEDAELVEA